MNRQGRLKLSLAGGIVTECMSGDFVFPSPEDAAWYVQNILGTTTIDVYLWCPLEGTSVLLEECLPASPPGDFEAWATDDAVQSFDSLEEAREWLSEHLPVAQHPQNHLIVQRSLDCYHLPTKTAPASGPLPEDFFLGGPSRRESIVKTFYPWARRDDPAPTPSPEPQGIKHDSGKETYGLLPARGSSILWGSNRVGGAFVDEVIRMTDPTTPDGASPDWEDLLDLPLFTIIDNVNDVLKFGAQKYAVDNWKIVPDAVDRYRAAARRHALAMLTDDDVHAVDPESGLPHWAHALTCLVFLRWFDAA